MKKQHVTWLCYECGSKHCNNSKPGVATWHEDECDICGKIRWVTQPRDFNHLKEDFYQNKAV